MVEYIKRDVAYNVLCDGCNACNGNHEICDEYRMISGIPAADVRENVHGEWIPSTEIMECVDCSVCGFRTVYGAMSNGDDYNYCPCCGADMRGEKNDQ